MERKCCKTVVALCCCPTATHVHRVLRISAAQGDALKALTAALASVDGNYSRFAISHSCPKLLSRWRQRLSPWPHTIYCPRGSAGDANCCISYGAIQPAVSCVGQVFWQTLSLPAKTDGAWTRATETKNPRNSEFLCALMQVLCPQPFRDVRCCTSSAAGLCLHVERCDTDGGWRIAYQERNLHQSQEIVADYLVLYAGACTGQQVSVCGARRSMGKARGTAQQVPVGRHGNVLTQRDLPYCAPAAL